MKKNIRKIISDIEADIEPEDDDFLDENEDPLADVRDNRRGSLFSARNIAIALTALIVAFFGGYFAAFALAHEKYVQTEAELSACRSSLESGRQEISALKDSVDRLNSSLAGFTAQQQPDSTVSRIQM